MKLNFYAWIKVCGALALLASTAGCDDDDCGSCHDDAPVVVAEAPCCAGLYPYRLDVRVQDTLGYTLGGASVEVIVAVVPEQRYVSSTRPDGIAVFYFEAPPDVTAIAYTCAPGYQCNAADIGTTPATSELFINVILAFSQP